MKKIMSLLLVVALISAMTVPVSADEGNASGWIELLETSSVQSNGENWFSINGKSGRVTVPLYSEKRLCKVDMLVWHQFAERITAASVTVGSQTNSLTIDHLGYGISRIYGNIPNAYYEFLHVDLTHSTSSAVTFELLSCKVTPVLTTDYPLKGTIFVENDTSNQMVAPGAYTVEGDGADLTVPWLLPIRIDDWRKYDSISIFGSLSGIGLNSVRVSLGAKGVPFEITYTNSVPSGAGESYYDSVTINYYETTDRYYGNISGSHDTNYDYRGSTLYSITIDLTNIDRTDPNSMLVYFSGVTYDLYSHAFNCQNMSGSVITADTSSVTWWTRFTTFMTDLFGGDTTEADQFADEMEQTNNALSDANDQMDAVTKPDVDDVPLDPSIYLDANGTAQAGQIVQSLLGNELVLPMASITLIVGLAAFIIF